MSNLKDEMDHIEIPKALRGKVSEAMLRAGTDIHSPMPNNKKRYVVPNVLTVIVTACGILFIYFIVYPPSCTFQSANGAKTTSYIYAPIILIPVLIILLVFVLMASYKVIKKWPKYKPYTIIVASFSVILLIQGMFFATISLQQRVVIPISMQIIQGKMPFFNINYVVDRFDSKANVIGFEVDGYMVELEKKKINNLLKGLHTQEKYRDENYIYKSENFSLNNDQLDAIILGNLDLSNSKVHFSDGISQPLIFEQFDYAKDGKGQFIRNNREKSMFAISGSVNHTDFIYRLNNETLIESIIFPKHPEINESYELVIDGTVIKRVNYKNLKNIDLLPYVVKDGYDLMLSVLNEEIDRKLVYLHYPVIIKGERNDYFPIIHRDIFDWNESYLKEQLLNLTE